MMTRRHAIKVGAVAGLGLAALPRTVAGTASLTRDPTGAGAEPAAELAARILADRTLSTARCMARDLLKGGLNAGGNYDQVWIRDTNTFIEVALEVNPPALFREALLNFFKFQGDHGDIVDGYRRYDARSVGGARLSSLAPDWMAFKNTVETDQESSLVQALFKYITVTNDQGILDEKIAGITARERLGRALNYVLTERFDRKHGLVWG
ncbi:MAG: hypothetical protein ACREE6_18060, partial [Limisphaerales bacterium]